MSRIGCEPRGDTVDILKVLQPQEPSPWFSFNTANEEKNNEEKIRLYTEAIALNSEFSEAFNNRGCVYYYDGDYEKALTDYEKALTYKPNSVMYITNKGNALRNLKKYDDAIKEYKKAFIIDKKYAEAYDGLSLLYDELNESKKCLDVLKDGLKNVPNSSLLHNSLAMCYRKENNFDLAFDHVNKAISIDSNYCYAYSTLAEIYSQLNDDEKFYKNIEIALEKGCAVWKYNDDPAYERYLQQDKFKDLLKNYQN